MNLRQLEVFHAIMSAASVTEAARILHVTQPAVSTVLKHAESQLGVRLFERVGGRLVPTPEAEQIFPEVDRIFSQLGMLRRLVKGVSEGQLGQLAIVGNPTLTNALLPRAVARFCRDHPQVRVRLDTATAAQVVDRVARREFDLGVIYARDQDVDTAAEVIGRSTIAAAMRPDHPLAQQDAIRPADLTGVDIVTFPRGTPIRVEIEAWLHEEGLVLDTLVEVSFSLTACFLANEGAGVALVDPLVVQTGDFPNLVVRPLMPARSIDIHLLSPRNRPRSRLSCDFEKTLRWVIGDLGAAV